MLDTCAIIDLMTDSDSLDKGFWDLIDDPDNLLYMSAESQKELIVNFNTRKLLPKYWSTAEEMLKAIKEEIEVETLPLTERVMFTYSRLQINVVQDHRDPSDHVIISHAITQRLTLLSSDDKFPFYRNQGLDLIEY